MSARSARNDAATPERTQRPPSSGSYQVGPQRPTEQREQASVQKYFDRFAEAMTSSDVRSLIELWGVPAFVIGRSEARVVQSEREIEEFFAEIAHAFQQRGITQTLAEIQSLDWVASDLVVVTVRWLLLDEQERERGEEISSYTLLRGEGGGYRLRSILQRGTGNE